MPYSRRVNIAAICGFSRCVIPYRMAREYGGDGREKFVGIADCQHQVLSQEIAGLVKIDIWGVIVKPARIAPQQSVVKILFRHVLKRNVLKTQRPYLVQPARKLVPRNLAL